MDPLSADDSTNSTGASRFEIHEISNLTSEFKIFQKGKERVAEATETSEQGVVVDIPKQACAKGQIVQIVGQITLGENEHEFSPTARILDVVDGQENRRQVTLEFQNFESKIWEDYLSSLKSKQQRMDEIFASMKG